MRYANLFIIHAALLIASLSASADNPPPATAPSTQPATCTLRGQINAVAGLDLQPIDLSRAVVYLESDPNLDGTPIPADHPYVAQYKKAFHPNFLVIPKGTQVEFPNWDHINHNVFSRSAAAPAFDLDRYGYGQSKTRQFDKIGVVQLFCNIHPYMHALIFVTPNVFFARADKTGNFEIDRIPPGRYHVSAWQERCQTRHEEVDIGAPGDAQISITLDQGRDSALADEAPRRAADYGTSHGLDVKLERLNLPVVTDVHPASTTMPSDLDN